MFTLNLRVISGKPSSDFPCSKSALKHLCSSAVVRPVVGDKMCKGPDKKKICVSLLVWRVNSYISCLWDSFRI